jgi:ubiquitin carboxyl-terminal hydrolase 7
MLNTHPKLRNVKRSTNAYMLVYIRESMREEILKEVTIGDIPDHLSKH